MILYTYKFKLKPTKKQCQLINKHCGASVWLYNHFLSLRKELYVKENKLLSYYESCKLLTELKKQETWLKEINSQSCQITLNYLDIAFQKFFRKECGYPKYHSTTKNYSFCIPQSITVENKRLYIPKFREGIRIIQHRNIEGKIKKASIIKRLNNYYVVLVVERNIQAFTKTQKVVGIDLGIKTLATLSDGIKIENPKTLKKYSNKLAKLQRYLARKQNKQSKRRDKNKLKISILQEKIKNIRHDNIHKLTNKIVHDFDIISVEKLDMKHMMKNHMLAKSVFDASFGMILEQLKYKCDWYGKQFIQIDKWFPSSKTCYHCGQEKHDLALSDRVWTCSKCNKKIDRDINAAQNILREGLRTLLYRQDLSITPKEILKNNDYENLFGSYENVSNL